MILIRQNQNTDRTHIKRLKIMCSLFIKKKQRKIKIIWGEKKYDLIMKIIKTTKNFNIQGESSILTCIPIIGPKLQIKHCFPL